MRKIDAFAHILPPSYARRLESIMSSGAASDRILGYQPWIHEDPALTGLDARWRVMDAFGDYRQVLTLAVPPLEELGGPAAALDLARAANDELAGLVASHPDRFAGFSAALPMSDPEAAAAELDRAMTGLGALGAQLHTNVSGAPLDQPRFTPVFATAARHRGALWIHPTRSPAWSDYPAERRSQYGIWWSLGWPYETSVCMARLVYSGFFDTYPDLPVITHHAGGMVPHFAGRLAPPLEDPARDGVMARLRAEPVDYFRRFYADTAMFGASHAVRCAVEFFGPDHVRRARGGPFDGLEIPVTENDNTLILLDFGGATFAVVDATFCAVATRSPEMEVFGLAGTLVVNRPGAGDAPGQLLVEMFRVDAAPGLPGWITPHSLDAEARPDRTEVLARASLVEHLADCLDAGTQPLPGAARARHVLEIMLAAQTAAATGRTVPLTTTFDR